MRFLVRLALNRVALAFAAYPAPGLTLTGLAPALIASIAFGLGGQHRQLDAERRARRRSDGAGSAVAAQRTHGESRRGDLTGVARRR